MLVPFARVRRPKAVLNTEYVPSSAPARLGDGRMGEQAPHGGPGIIIPQLEID